MLAGDHVGLVRGPVETAAVGEVVLPGRAHRARQIAGRDERGVDHAVGGEEAGALAEQKDVCGRVEGLRAVDARRERDFETGRETVAGDAVAEQVAEGFPAAQRDRDGAGLEIAHDAPVLEAGGRREIEHGLLRRFVVVAALHQALREGEEYAGLDLGFSEKSSRRAARVEVAQKRAALVMELEGQAGEEDLVEIAVVEFEAGERGLDRVLGPAGHRIAAHQSVGARGEIAREKFDGGADFRAHAGSP